MNKLDSADENEKKNAQSHSSVECFDWIYSVRYTCSLSCACLHACSICVTSYISVNVILSDGIFYSCVALLLLLLSFLYFLFISLDALKMNRPTLIHIHMQKHIREQFLKRKTFAHSKYKIHIHRNTCNQFGLNQHRVNVTSSTRICYSFNVSMFIAINNEYIRKFKSLNISFVCCLD